MRGLLDLAGSLVSQAAWNAELPTAFFPFCGCLAVYLLWRCGCPARIEALLPVRGKWGRWLLTVLIALPCAAVVAWSFDLI